jgi:uncharacterized protein (TIGR02246 family)
MKIVCSALLGLLLAVVGPGAADDAPKASPATARPAQTKAETPNPSPSADEVAIRASIGAFVQAFQKGDAHAIAAMFAQDGEAIDAEGHAIQGREALEAHYAQRFADSPDLKMESDVEVITILAPGVARVIGKSKLVPSDGSPGATTSRHTAILVKHDGHWVAASLRELRDPDMSPHEHLKELEWLVGDWVEETEDAVVHTSFAWTDKQNYLLRSFDVRVKGKPALTGTQRIGWDPLTKQIKSWVFDDQGGYGEGLWMRSGNQWVIKATGVRPDGRTATATQVLTFVDKNSLRWKSIDRTHGDEIAEEIAEVVMVRKPPAPR